MELNGIPLHPLVVHGAVVLTPMAAVAAGLFAVVPRWRWALRWPTPLLALGAAASVWLASTTGDDLKHTRGLRSQLIETHEMWAGRLQTGMWVLAALAAVAWWVLPVTARLMGQDDRTSPVGVLVKPLVVLLPILAVVSLYLVYMTGDAGAKAVWAVSG